MVPHEDVWEPRKKPPLGREQNAEIEIGAPGTLVLIMEFPSGNRAHGHLPCCSSCRAFLLSDSKLHLPRPSDRPQRQPRLEHRPDALSLSLRQPSQFSFHLTLIRRNINREHTTDSPLEDDVYSYLMIMLLCTKRMTSSDPWSSRRASRTQETIQKAVRRRTPPPSTENMYGTRPRPVNTRTPTDDMLTSRTARASRKSYSGSRRRAPPSPRRP